MEIVIYIIIGAFFLFIIIAGVVKMAVKEALYEFKEDVIKELNFLKSYEDSRND